MDYLGGVSPPGVIMGCIVTYCDLGGREEIGSTGNVTGPYRSEVVLLEMGH